MRPKARRRRANQGGQPEQRLFRLGFSRVNGYYLVSNLESGGPYTVTVKRHRYVAADRNDVVVPLSQTTRVDFKLSPASGRPRPGPGHRPERRRDFSPTRQVSTQVSRLTHHPHAAAESEHHRQCEADAARSSTPSSGGVSAGGMYNREQFHGSTARARMTLQSQ